MIVVGIVDYGLGNQTSVRHALSAIGFRVLVSADTEALEHTDVLVLPGVGAFPAAMDALNARGLTSFVQSRVKSGGPVIGICLGMQLFASVSHEHKRTPGLSLIDGDVVPLVGAKWHIGWNSIRCSHGDPLLDPSDGEAFYFNHSFTFNCPAKYQAAVASHYGNVPAIVRRANVVGLQFHPEKSQLAGRVLLKNLVTGLHRA